MLTGVRGKARVSPNDSIRSISARMRSVSAQMSWVSSRFGRRQMFFDQLRGAADAGQRILDFVRQHRRHAVHRAHRAAMQQLAVDALRQAALLQQ